MSPGPARDPSLTQDLPPRLQEADAHQVGERAHVHVPYVRHLVGQDEDVRVAVHRAVGQRVHQAPRLRPLALPRRARAGRGAVERARHLDAEHLRVVLEPRVEVGDAVGRAGGREPGPGGRAREIVYVAEGPPDQLCALGPLGYEDCVIQLQELRHGLGKRRDGPGPVVVDPGQQGSVQEHEVDPGRALERQVGLELHPPALQEEVGIVDGPAADLHRHTRRAHLVPGGRDVVGARIHRYCVDRVHVEPLELEVVPAGVYAGLAGLPGLRRVLHPQLPGPVDHPAVLDARGQARGTPERVLYQLLYQRSPMAAGQI